MRFCSFFGKLKEIVKLFGTKKRVPFPALSFHSFTTSIFSMPYARKSGSSSAVISSPLAAIGIAGGQETQGLHKSAPPLLRRKSPPICRKSLPNPHFLLRICGICEVLFFPSAANAPVLFQCAENPVPYFRGLPSAPPHPNRQIHIRLHAHAKFCDLSAAIALFARKNCQLQGVAVHHDCPPCFLAVLSVSNLSNLSTPVHSYFRLPASKYAAALNAATSPSPTALAI